MYYVILDTSKNMNYTTLFFDLNNYSTAGISNVHIVKHVQYKDGLKTEGA